MTHPAELPLVRVASEIAAAVRVLARHRYGAIILWDPSVEIAGGVVLDARRVSRELLVSIFVPESLNRLRGGATVVRADRVERASVPLAWTDVVERAAELAAGVAFEVDEDTGEIRTVDAVGRVEVIDAASVARVLYQRALDAARLAR